MSDDFEIRISLPLDSDEFLRRQCPRCTRQFKWHHGPANEEAEQHDRPAAYSCPLCGQPVADGSWNTAAQLDLIKRAALPAAAQRISDELESIFRGVKGVTYTRGTNEAADFADPLVEPDDMTIVSSPCHSYEPVKVPDDHTGPLYCLVKSFGLVYEGLDPSVMV